MARTLEDIRPGQSGIIARVGNEKGAVKRRLVDMGLTPGTLVTVKKGGSLRRPSGGQPEGV